MIAIRYFNFSRLFCTVFGVTEEYMQRELLVEQGPITQLRENTDLPEGSTSTNMSSSLPSIQRRPTLKWVCYFTLRYISLHKLKFIPAVRNMLRTKEMHLTSRFCAWYNCEK